MIYSDTPTVTGWPHRRHYALLALVFLAVAVFGSLVPLHYRPLGIHEAVERFKQIFARPVQLSRTDFAANVLLFVPIGYCFLAVLAVDQGKRLLTVLCVPPVILTCAAASLAIEFAQLWFPGRTTSVSDVAAQIVGTVFGVGLWLTVGSTLTDWLRSYALLQRPGQRIDWLLKAYFIGLLIYSVLPLDLTLSPWELAHKYRQGKIALVPFSGIRLNFASSYVLLTDVAVFIPVGMLAATWPRSSRRPVRPIGTSVPLGGLVVLAIELAQLLVYSRYTDTTDLITGTFGVWIGAWLMQRWRGGGEHDPQAVASGPGRQVWLCFGLAAVYAVFLVVVFCAPFEPIDDPQQIKARLGGFLRIPFVSLQDGTPFNAITQVLKKGLFFAPLGVLFALAAVRLPIPRPIRRILLGVLLLVAAGVATAIEMAQVVLPPHVPNVTDVILCTGGAAIGMFVTLRIVGSGKTAT